MHIISSIIACSFKTEKTFLQEKQYWVSKFQEKEHKTLGECSRPEHLLVSDIEELRKALGLENFILIGHVWGGVLNAHYMVEHPENLDGIIFLNTEPVSSNSMRIASKVLKKKLAATYRDIDSLPSIAELNSYEKLEKYSDIQVEEGFKKLFASFFYNPEKVELLNLTRPTKSGYRVRGVMQKMLFSIPGINLIPKLKSLEVPTLIIHSEEDIDLLEGVSEIHSAMRNSKLVVLKECGRFPYIEKPDELKGIINNFLKNSLNQHGH